MADGWVKLRRELAEDKVWLQKPFTDGQALVDLLLRVTFKTHTVGSKRFLAGCVYTSTKALSDRWGWTYEQVRWFLKKMVSTKKLKVKAWPEGPGVEIYVIGWNPSEEEHQQKHTVKPRKTGAQPQGPQGLPQHFSTVESAKSDAEPQGLHHLQKNRLPYREEAEMIKGGGPPLGSPPEGGASRPTEEEIDPIDMVLKTMIREEDDGYV